MRWLQNISFSNNTSSNTTAAAAPPSSSSSSSSAAADSNFSKHRKLRYLRGGGLVLRFGGGTAINRQRKLRFVTGNDDDDVTTTQQNKNSSISSASMKPSTNSVQLSRSLSANGSSPVVAAVPPKLSSSVPVPLPLPLPFNSCDGDLRFPSPKENKEREKDKEKDRDGVSSRERDNGDGLSSSNCSVARVCVGRERRKIVDPLGIRINAPTRSAPTSPAVSPRRLATAADSLPYYQMIAKNQVWSAPEMATYDIPGLPTPAFFDFAALSTDTSPLHSPSNRSPRTNPKSPTGQASPLNAKLSTETLTPARENIANLEFHPLPLPPGASRPSISSPAAQVVAKTEAMLLKSRWQKGKLIGRGTFGSVYVASNRENGALCAMKEVDIFPDDPTSAESIKQLEQEIKVLSKLKHPNIVQYYGSEIVQHHFYIYLEYVHPGSINKYVREHCGAITENVVRSFSRHILSGLAYLHSMKTVHRDIKGANLLVDASGVVKLADFGMSKHLTGQAAELSLKGSPYWMAPELLQAVMQKDSNSDLALAVDIWSLGCTIIEMFTGKPPWSDYEGAAAMFKVLKDIPPIPETLSPEGKDFLCCCFRRNPADRPSASILLEHRWLKNSNQIDFSPSTPSINGIKLADLTHGPNALEVKLDQTPILPCSPSANGKVTSDSKTTKQFHHEASNLTVMVGVCYSPRSILEVLPISSPPGQNINHHRSSLSTPNLNKTAVKTNHIVR